MRRIFIYLFFILLIPANILSQNKEHGIPSFKNISPITYAQESQNFSIIQDQNHLMYFGNVNGIMEYDNSSWRLIPVAGRPEMDINSQNEIYFGGYNQLGKLVHKNGLLSTELFNYKKEINPGQINKILAFEDEVFFSTSHQLLSYIDDTIEVQLSNIRGINIFKIHDKLYVFVPNKGLFTWKNKKIIPAENFTKLKNTHILDMYELNDRQILIKPENQRGFLIYENNRLYRFRTEADLFMLQNKYSVSTNLSNGNIIIGTRLGGIVCINNKGEFIFALNRNNGLRDNHITDLYIDINNKVWVTTYNGIALIETPSPFDFFDVNFGLNGAIISVLRKDNSLYVATTTGVFRYFYGNIYETEISEFNNRKRFRRIDGISNITWHLSEINNNLFAASSSGVFLIKNNRAIKALEGQYNKIVQSEINPKICLIGGSNGLLISKISGNYFDTIGYVEGLNYNIRTINIDKTGTVWLGTNADGLFKLNFNGDYKTNTDFLSFNEKNAFPKRFNWVDVYQQSFGTMFSTQKGLFNYNYNTNRFEYDTLLGYDFEQENMYIYPIIEDKNKNLWFSCTFSNKYYKETGVALFNQKDNTYTKTINPFALIRKFPIESIYAESDDNIWFGTTESLIKYKHNFYDIHKSTAPCFIREITIGYDSVIYIPPDFDSSRENKFEILFSDKSVRFDFTYLQYNSYGSNEFQVFLKGFDSEWSEWTQECFKEYTALTGKEYVFMVRARDVYGNISEETAIYFKVIPPFYQTIYAYIFYVLLLGALIYLILKLNELRHAKEHYRLEKLVEQRTNELSHQKEQTEKLVKKLLPDYTADEIKKTGEAKSQKYEMVSVLFADIQGFTKIAEKENTEKLITCLNNIFSDFDKIIIKYNILKIKTIGDAYMCAGGIPVAEKTNPIEVVLAGMEMQNKIKLYNQENDLKIKLRIGIHTGPVVSGVVGSNKLEYDIWGDAVNIASRMESHGLVNKVNVSQSTHSYIQDFFDCTHRGKINIKYKGELEMYLVNNIKAELSEGHNSLLPNRDFLIKLQHIKLKDIQEEILEQLEKNLPKNLYYHNLKHTLNVLYVVENFARKEKVNEEEMLLLKCAALFHDAGFLVSYDDNEKIGAKMATQTLRKYKFSQDQIATVERLILATKMPPNPKDLLEKIICDADLDYLGRPDFIPISQNLFRELFERGKVNTIQEWNKFQYKFMTEHKFFTETARKKREPVKKLVMEELKTLI